jgi:hypothetical protein
LRCPGGRCEGGCSGGGTADRSADARPQSRRLQGELLARCASVVRASAPVMVSGVRARPSVEYVRIEGRVPAAEAARIQRNAESEPVTARLGPRSRPSSRACGCSVAWAESRTDAGRLLSRIAASAATVAVAGPPRLEMSATGAGQAGASVPRGSEEHRQDTEDDGDPLLSFKKAYGLPTGEPTSPTASREKLAGRCPPTAIMAHGQAAEPATCRRRATRP